jgi:hypothetical protein
MESIILSATELQLSSTLFGASIRRRVAPISEIRDVRFFPKCFKGSNYPVRSNITYEVAHRKVKLAAGLDEPEARTLINLMLTVCPFSQVKSRHMTP